MKYLYLVLLLLPLKVLGQVKLQLLNGVTTSLNSITSELQIDCVLTF